MLDYAGFGTIAIASIKQLKKEFYAEKLATQQLKRQIHQQQNQIDELKAKVEQLTN